MFLFAPSPTGSGHNMRALAIASALKQLSPTTKSTVLLGSLQHIFAPLFKTAGVEVTDIAGRLVDYSTSSHLDKLLNWERFVGDYVANTFVSGERILTYIALLLEEKPHVVVSDYNMCAAIAAHILGIPHALITERYDYTMLQLTDDQLKEGGFIIPNTDLERARTALHALFEWITGNSKLVLTDKPPIPEMDANTPVFASLKAENGHFVGPMVRKGEPHDEEKIEAIRSDLNISPEPYIVASISGTTMFLENRDALLSCYMDTFHLLRQRYKNLTMVLIGRGENLPATDGVVQASYIPNWAPLLHGAELLVSAPGWITATEVASMQIPTLFVLPSASEFHEVEALERLSRLGYPTYMGTEPAALSDRISAVIDMPRRHEHFASASSKLAFPDNDGAGRAARHLISLLGRA